MYNSRYNFIKNGLKAAVATTKVILVKTIVCAYVTIHLTTASGHDAGDELTSLICYEYHSGDC